MRHPHADLIKEWAEDTSRIVQARFDEKHKWKDCKDGPYWLEEYKYRFKPEPKPDVVRYRNVSNNTGWSDSADDANIKLTFDGETGKLKSAEVIDGDT